MFRNRSTTPKVMANDTVLRDADRIGFAASFLCASTRAAAIASELRRWGGRGGWIDIDRVSWCRDALGATTHARLRRHRAYRLGDMGAGLCWCGQARHAAADHTAIHARS